MLVAGGGFAGGYVARLLGRRGATIVSPENFMLYTPLLPEAASGTLEPRHVVVPLRQMCPHAELLLGRVTAVDAKQRTAHVETPEAGSFEIAWEHLVLALGAVARTLPGTRPGRARGRVQGPRRTRSTSATTSCESSRPPTPSSTRSAAPPTSSFVFVGAGYAGVEALAELSDLVADALRYYPRLREARQRWVLVDAAPKILPEIPPRLGEYAARELAGRGVEIHVSTTLESLTESEAVLSNGERITTHTLVWTAGVKANPTLGELGLPLDERGRIRVDPLLHVEGHDRVWALGDGAAVPNQATPGRVDPPTCQHALRQARRLAKNLTGEPQPYAYRMLGQVATLGRYKGIADVLGIRIRGFPGWFVTRSYHLFQLPLVTRKIRVVVDWTTALFFRRDIAELSGLGHPHRLE